MLSHIRTWQVIAVQLAFGGASVLCLTTALHYPDVAHRPEPAPGTLFLLLLGSLTAVVLALSAAGARSPKAKTTGVIASTIAIWLFGSYALVLIWINTYGT
jgi:hypothetical protein